MYKVIKINEAVATRTIELQNEITDTKDLCLDDSVLVSDENFEFMQVGKIKGVFLDLGFKEEVIREKKFLVFKDCYCIISYLNKLSSFVIESADSYDEAQKGLLEDGDLYSIKLSERELLDVIRNDLVKDYM